MQGRSKDRVCVDVVSGCNAHDTTLCVHVHVSAGLLAPSSITLAADAVFDFMW
jgi:hypothetical protein